MKDYRIPVAISALLLFLTWGLALYTSYYYSVPFWSPSTVGTLVQFICMLFIVVIDTRSQR